MQLEELFLSAVAFAVAAIPTALPAVTTAILSKGSQMLADAGAIMKRLRSVETLGSTSALNSDKTGTLTLNQMTAVQMATMAGRYTISGDGYSTIGQISHAGGQPDVPLEQFLLPMALCADAEVRDGALVGDPTEGALVVLAAKGGVDPALTRERYPRVATLPFDAAYKMMATFHRMTDDAGKDVVRCYVKGAPDQLLARAVSAHGPDGTERPVAELRDKYLAENERLGTLGLRVMATGYKDFDPATFDPDGDMLPMLDGLKLLAMVGIVDPPRPAAKDAIATAHAAGIQVRMITGDHAVTAEAIARQLGIEGRAMTGADFRALSDEEAMRQIDDIGVLARVSPEDKVHLVDILRKKGHVVAMTGDGVNDAPALKKADIGIAMGITGTEVSKQAAVMILTDDNFGTIVKAVGLGRSVYDNLLRFIRFQMAGLFGYIATFLGSSLLNILGGIPFLPLQTMWLNFTVNVFQAIGLGYGKPREGLMEVPPRPKEQQIIPRRLMSWLVFVGLVMAAGTLGVLAWGSNQYGDVVARTMGMTTFALFRLFSSLETADEDESLFSGSILGNRPLLLATGLSVLTIILAMEFGFLQRLLGTISLTVDQWVICIVVSLSLIVVEEVRKFLRIRAADEVATTPLRGGIGRASRKGRIEADSTPRPLKDAQRGGTSVAKKKDKKADKDRAVKRQDDGEASACADRASSPKMQRKAYERRDAPSPRRAGGDAGVGEGDRRQGLRRVRGPRHGRQGRHHQAHHRARQPARVQGRGAVRPDRARAVADVRAALHPALPGGR